ncbi:N-acetylmuramoyl-L-alanine amidase [Wukongibacter baidiensis]|uniref:N-acetylmuramoyl-L-alanine amidase n=1 Tax=Wukongibacter baidiensis TaxID=1723361 RepID=UPI003D7F7FEC
MKIVESNLRFRNKLKKFKEPSMIVIHHAAHSSATVLDIHRWHLKNGWSGFGYHFLVTKDGRIHRGRPENAIGAHTKGYNNISLGICMQGDYEVEKVPEIQFKALMELCQYLCEKYNVGTIKGHRELQANNCPGLNFPLGAIRNRTFDKIDTYTVKSGDTLWSIAKSFNISVDILISLNGLNGSLIYPNQVLRIM